MMRRNCRDRNCQNVVFMSGHPDLNFEIVPISIREQISRKNSSVPRTTSLASTSNLAKPCLRTEEVGGEVVVGMGVVVGMVVHYHLRVSKIELQAQLLIVPAD